MNMKSPRLPTMAKRFDPGIPVLIAEQNGPNTVRGWCPYCRQFHIHGIPLGHRAAHCADEKSPFYRSGYFLVDRQTAERMHRRRR
jgi:hypothetical protein